MDDRQRQAVVKLRSLGYGYKAIATQLGLSREQVRYWCKNQPAPTRKLTIAVEQFCRWCATELGANPRARFCCQNHRLTWWRHHPECGVRQAYTTHACAYCQTKFTSYGNKNRKYCSHPCYVKARFATRGGR